MGYRLETYSLEELHRISKRTPGAPCLFWCLPVGRWNSLEIQELWGLFTRERGYCNSVGLFLATNQHDDHQERNFRSSEDFGARLTQLLPEGMTFDQDSLNRKQLLILSGAYPQPGWGVLLDAPQNFSAPFLRDLVTRVIDGLNEQEDCRAAVKSAATLQAVYRQLQTTKQEPPVNEELEKHNHRLQQLQETQKSLTALLRALNECEMPSLYDLRKELRSHNTLNLAIQSEEIFKTFNLARVIVHLKSDEKRAALPGVLSELLAPGCAAADSVMQKADALGISIIVKAWRELRPEVSPAEVSQWAKSTFEQLTEQFSAELHQAVAEILARQAECSKAIQKAKLNHCKGLEDHRKRVEELSTDFKKAMQSGLAHQWEWGPQFLVALERRCHLENVRVRSIAWDRPRMIGWKLWVLGVRLTVEDLHVRSRELVPASDVIFPANNGSLATGSYFTDYVHFVATSDLRRSTRSITSSFLEGLLKPSDLTACFSRLDVPGVDDIDRSAKVDHLLKNLGWNDDEFETGCSIANCLTLKEGKLSLRPGFSFSELRKSLESFCKDLLDVLTERLSLTEAELWSAVSKHASYYRRNQPTWDKEIASLSLGGAIILLKALGPLGFPDASDNWKVLLNCLATLKNGLNPECHHQEEDRVNAVAPSIPEAIKTILSQASVIVSEMPWHFTVQQTTGEQPKIVTGRAWSHSHPEERLLRVLLWTGQPLGRRALIWNPTRINPIITDPTVLSRPRMSNE